MSQPAHEQRVVALKAGVVASSGQVRDHGDAALDKECVRASGDDVEDLALEAGEIVRNDLRVVRLVGYPSG